MGKSFVVYLINPPRVPRRRRNPTQRGMSARKGAPCKCEDQADHRNGGAGWVEQSGQIMLQIFLPESSDGQQKRYQDPEHHAGKYIDAAGSGAEELLEEGAGITHHYGNV